MAADDAAAGVFRLLQSLAVGRDVCSLVGHTLALSPLVAACGAAAFVVLNTLAEILPGRHASLSVAALDCDRAEALALSSRPRVTAGDAAARVLWLSEKLAIRRGRLGHVGDTPPAVCRRVAARRAAAAIGGDAITESRVNGRGDLRQRVDVMREVGLELLDAARAANVDNLAVVELHDVGVLVGRGDERLARDGASHVLAGCTIVAPRGECQTGKGATAMDAGEAAHRATSHRMGACHPCSDMPPDFH